MCKPRPGNSRATTIGLKIPCRIKTFAMIYECVEAASKKFVFIIDFCSIPYNILYDFQFTPAVAGDSLPSRGPVRQEKRFIRNHSVKVDTSTVEHIYVWIAAIV